MWWLAFLVADWTGAGSCRPCHAAMFGGHAHYSALAKPDPQPRPHEPFRRGPYSLRIDGARARGWTPTESIDLPIDWAFGSGRQAVTYVSRVDSNWYFEHSLSWFPATRSFGLTPGHAGREPKDLKEAAGLLYRATDPQHGIAGCFECHATGPVSFDKDGAVRFREAGVQCEACHGPGSAHIATSRVR
ncbi:MAG: hypothetical protein FJW39_27700, partial [Acidobacteria bacterium]|nr:hypothetical protein [Acidobacteriota bacterium]